MSSFLISGGKPISGTLDLVGSKNAVLPILAATLLTKDKFSLHSVPGISDVRVMLHLLEAYGVKWQMSNLGEDLFIDTSEIFEGEINKTEYEKIRGSNLMLGAVLARFGKVHGYFPGGDRIGTRNMDAHFDAFEQSGYTVTRNQDGSYDIFKTDNKDDRDIFLYEASPTGTENAILVNVLGKGKSVIENVACEPQVRDLCEFLVKMGAKIEGIGTNRLVITKVPELKGVEFNIMKDYVYAFSFIVMSLMTQGELFIKDIRKDDFLPFFPLFKYFSVNFDFIDETTIHFPGGQVLRKNPKYDIYTNVGIYSEPWPRFPTDLLPMVVSLATQAEGEFLIFEKMYAGRIENSLPLSELGADITLLDPHRVIVKGKTDLHGGKLNCPDLRSGVIYLSAMLAAIGDSNLYNIGHIERGYPKIEETLNKLGANISRYEDNI